MQKGSSMQGSSERPAIFRQKQTYQARRNTPEHEGEKLLGGRKVPAMAAMFGTLEVPGSFPPNRPAHSLQPPVKEDGSLSETAAPLLRGGEVSQAHRAILT